MVFLIPPRFESCKKITSDDGRFVGETLLSSMYLRLLSSDLQVFMENTTFPDWFKENHSGTGLRRASLSQVVSCSLIVTYSCYLFTFSGWILQPFRVDWILYAPASHAIFKRWSEAYHIKCIFLVSWQRITGLLLKMRSSKVKQGKWGSLLCKGE